MPQEIYSYRPLSEEEKTAFQGFLDCGFHISFPYNHDPDMLGKIEPYFPYIKEVFAALHPTIFPSLRVWDLQQSPEEYLKVLCDMASELKKHDIWLNIVLNMGARTDIMRQPVFRHIEQLTKCGLIRVTVSDLFWAEIIRNRFPDISLGSSVSSDVRSQAAAQIWRDWVGADFIVVSTIINKDLRRIRQIHDLGLKVKIVMNDKCIPECPLQMRHIALLGAQNNRWEEEPETMDVSFPCLQLRHSLPPWHWAKKEILPFSLPRYKGILDSVKITDRRATTENNIQTMRDYLEMKRDVHPTIGYRETMEAFERITKCDRNCAECGWCPENIKMAEERGDYIRQDLGRLQNTEGTQTQWRKSNLMIDFSRESLKSGPSIKSQEIMTGQKAQQPDKPTRQPEVQETTDLRTEARNQKPEPASEHRDETENGISNTVAGIIECPPELEGADSLRWWSRRLQNDWNNAELAEMLRSLTAVFGDIIREGRDNPCGYEFRRVAQAPEGGLLMEFGSGSEVLVLHISRSEKPDAAQFSVGQYGLGFHKNTRAADSGMKCMKKYLDNVLGNGN